MALTAPVYAVNNIQTLDDLTLEQATAVKVLHDKAGADTKAFIIALLAELASVTDGTSGADNLGMTPIAETGTANKVQTIIEALITRLKATTDSVSGADLIGLTAIPGVTGATLQLFLEALKTYVDSQDTALQGQNVKLTGDQTIEGAKTFSSSPIIPNPTIDAQAATKKYVDTPDAQNVKLTGNQTIGGVKTFDWVNVPIPSLDYQATPKKYVGDNFTTKEEITTTRKLSATADFTGSWFGITNPALADPGIAGVVESHTTQLAETTIELALKANDNAVRKTAVKIKLEDADSDFIGAIAGTATFNLLSIPQDVSVTNKKLDIPSAESVNTTRAILNNANSNIFSTLDEGLKMVTVDTGLAPLTGFMPGGSSTFSYLADAITITTGGTFATLIELVINNADMIAIKAAGGLNAYFGITPLTLASGGLACILYSVKGTTVTSIFSKTIIVPPVADTLYTVDEFIPSSSIPTDAECLRLYINQTTPLSAGTVKIDGLRINKGDIRGYNPIPLRLNAITQYSELLGLEGNDKVGKTANFVGDSMTYRDQYQPIVRTALGLVETPNYGVSSATVATNSAMPLISFVERVIDCVDADIWFVLGGVNDWLYKTPLGTITSIDTGVFYGGLKFVCENILNRSNKPKLLLATPLQSNRNGLNGATPDLTMLAFAKAIKDVGEYYSVPVLDLYGLGGINPLSLMYYTDDGIHPNLTYGMPLLASKITKALRTI